MTDKPLDGITVVALEHAVSAPYCSSRLADAGARVIKVERPEGDLARDFDHAVHGESSYFLWINRGKERIVLDLRREEDRARLDAMLAGADVFIQNLSPGAAERLGFGSAALGERHPRLITCDITGYGDIGPMADLKAYDMLVQAESGLIAVNGAPGPWGRIGVSICDIAAGMNAIQAILLALLKRERTGKGSRLSVSLFDSAAEIMAVPYLQARYGRAAPERIGLKHPGLASYGPLMTSDGREVILALHNDDTWARFCTVALGADDLVDDPRFADNASRLQNQTLLESVIQATLGRFTYAQVADRLTDAQTPFGVINSVYDLIEHPQLRTRPMPVHGRTIEVPAPPCVTPWDDDAFREAPSIEGKGPAHKAPA